MQSPFSIPPYTEAGVQKLVGLDCRVPVQANPSKGWWCHITEVKFIHEHSVFVKVESHYKFGNPKWFALSQVRFQNHCDEPLIVAMHRAKIYDKAKV